jgi:hypothetical protein
MARRSTETVVKHDFAALIAERAYFKAERRGFVPGFELDDWLAAEREVLGVAPPSKVRKTASRSKNGA